MSNRNIYINNHTRAYTHTSQYTKYVRTVCIQAFYDDSVYITVTKRQLKNCVKKKNPIITIHVGISSYVARVSFAFGR